MDLAFSDRNNGNVLKLILLSDQLLQNKIFTYYIELYRNSTADASALCYQN